MKFDNSDEREIFRTGTRISDSKAWIFSLFRQIREFLEERRHPAPPIAITATPVAVKEIWSKRQNHIPGLLSLLAHVSVVTALIVLSVTSYNKPNLVADNSGLMESISLSLPPLPARSNGGGGGGTKAPTPASKGVLPKIADKQFVPPTPIIKNMSPELAAVPTIIDLNLGKLPQQNVLLQLGDPNGIPGPASAGTGEGGGIGKGKGRGVGDDEGPGVGTGGTGVGRDPNPVVRIGNGGASAPSCPLPKSEPNYTDDARKAHIQGTVVLDVIVNRDGTVSVSKVAQMIGYGLDDEARQFVAKNFKCKPGSYQGQAVATPVRIDVNFHLY